MSKTCYHCGAPATSQDHIPPKVFFPAEKDTGGTDYRKNLLKVPSCDKHNADFSKDDEYVAYLLATSCTNNQVGTAHAITKAYRALARSRKLAGRVFDQAQRVELDGQQTVALKADIEAFIAVLTRIARGLYFKETGGLVPHDLIAVSPQMLTSGHPMYNEWSTLFHAMSQLDFEPGLPCENPDVFSYTRYYTTTPKHGPVVCFLLRFYDGVDVFVGPKTNS